MIIALRLSAALACAALPRLAEVEQPASTELKSFRFTDGFTAVGHYVGNRGNASARPDGSGTARTRLQLLLRDRASADQFRLFGHGVFLTDRQGSMLKIASVDYYVGLTRHGDTGGWLGLGRGEALPLDRKGKSTRFWDLRLGRAYAAGPTLVGGFVGWNFKNDGRPARPDQSGEAYLSYSAFLNLRLAGPLRARVNADLLTDRERRRYRPVSLDLKTSLGLVHGGSEAAFAYEPWYGAGATHETWSILYTFRFDSRAGESQ